ncbi:Outer membrane usher protein papC precursor [Serratia plymuthica]|uniref:fimbria/pilus outer membrane usher protein n=1 Tax=Serratia plymuthica TaxID=82996 RepID=UPI002178353B|nr:Outer membrane usher protein papC precursor [Serratia plymuthica]
MSFAMDRTSIRMRITIRVIIFLSGCLISFKSLAVEFNVNFIDSADRNNVDLSRFQVANYIAPGEYLLDVVLNGRTLGDQSLIKYIPTEDNKNSRLCVPPSLVDKFDLTKAAQEQLTLWHQGECTSLDRQKEITARYDQEKQTLNISIPQAWLTFHDENWVPPSQWDNGVNGALLDYNLLGSQYMPQHGDSSTSFSSYGTTGFNLGAWRARADYQYSAARTSGSPANDKFIWTQTYLFRALPSIGARLTGGQTYFSSDIFDSFRFVGVSVNSDQRMLPPSLRGYAPQVTGIAKTNAKVSISQNGRVIYQTNVSPGPFVVQDLTEAVQGALDVKIEEENGSVTTYQVTTATIPFLTRKGQVRFKTAMGKPTTGSSNHVLQPGFYSGEMSWGALNDFSVYGGLIATTGNYQAQALGVGQNLQKLGAVSFDVTRSSATVPVAGKQTGFSYRANYSKRFDSTGSQITFAGYRFSEKTFMSFNQYLDKVNGDGYSRDDKQTYTVTANQFLPWPAITLYLSATHKVYWNENPSNNYSVSVSKIFDIGRFTGISGTLSASKLRYRDTDENQMFLSFSLPLSSGQQISYDAQQDSQSGFSQTTSYYNSQDPNNSWRVGAGGSSPDLQKGDGVFRANYQHMSPYGQLGVNGSVKNNDYRSVNANWYGSFTATAAGAALHQSSSGSEPRMMVSAGVKGIPISEGASVTNDYGIAVVNGVSSYQTSDIRVDVNHLPDDVEVYSSVVSKTLTEGAIGFRKIRAIKGERLMAVIRLADGSYPPLGSSVMDNSSGFEAGLIGDGGLAYLAGVSGEKSLTVRWGEGQQCRIQVPSQPVVSTGQVLLPCN